MKCLCFHRIFLWFSQKNGEFDMDTFDSDKTAPLPQKYRKSQIDRNGFLSPNYGQSERESTSTTVPAVGTEPNRFSQISSDKVKCRLLSSIFINYENKKKKNKQIERERE